MCFAFFCAVNITGDIKNSIQNWQNLNKIDQSCGNIESKEKTEDIMQMSGLGLQVTLCIYYRTTQISVTVICFLGHPVHEKTTK